MTCHYPDLGSKDPSPHDQSEALPWSEKSRYRCGISAILPQTSFREETRNQPWWRLGGSIPSDKEGRMGAAHPDPEIRGRLGLKKIFFRTFGPQFGLKIGVRGGGTGFLGPLPWIRHCRLQNRNSISIIGTWHSWKKFKRGRLRT